MIINIKVIPNSKQNKIEKISEESYRVHLKEKPLKGKANLALIKFLSFYFKIPRNEIEIIKGKTSQKKIVKIGK